MSQVLAYKKFSKFVIPIPENIVLYGESCIAIDRSVWYCKRPSVTKCTVQRCDRGVQIENV